MKDGKRVDSAGNARWYLNNVLHKEGGPAIKYKNGEEHWYFNGERHRMDGPASTYYSPTLLIAMHWFINGKRHREDGPAVVYPNRRGDWYLNGRNTAKFNVFLVALNKSLNLNEFWK